jgi:ADP-ribosylglycohydrolase
MLNSNKILSGLMGVCVGDALGVPVEFTSREERTKDPVITMRGYGTWEQLPGTWSDDSSLMFCLAESLCNGFSLDEIAKSFWRWYKEGYWSARGEVFDIGNTTFLAIVDWKQGKPPLEAGGKSENSNGNGSLMRILPMAFLHQNLDFPNLIQHTHQVSCITHAHLRYSAGVASRTQLAGFTLALHSHYSKVLIYQLLTNRELSKFNRYILHLNIYRKYPILPGFLVVRSINYPWRTFVRVVM